MESCIEELSSTQRQIVRERDDLLQRLASFREKSTELEECLKAAEHESQRTTENLRVGDLYVQCGIDITFYTTTMSCWKFI